MLVQNYYLILIIFSSFSARNKQISKKRIFSKVYIIFQSKFRYLLRKLQIAVAIARTLQIYSILLTNISCSPSIFSLFFGSRRTFFGPFWVFQHIFDTEINIKPHSKLISATLRCLFCVKTRGGHDSCLENIFRKFPMYFGKFPREKWQKKNRRFLAH